MVTECTQSYEVHNTTAHSIIHYNIIHSYNAVVLLVHITYVVSSSTNSLWLLLSVRWPV